MRLSGARAPENRFFEKFSAKYYPNLTDDQDFRLASRNGKKAKDVHHAPSFA
jgi:hypothetical protein